MLVRLALVWLIGLVQAEQPVAAPAQDAVRWQAPPGCPDRAALLSAISRRLGRPLAGAEIDAEVRRDGREYFLKWRLTVDARSETRELRDASCVAIVEAIAVRVAAALEPAVAVPEPPIAVPEPPAPVEPTPTPEPAPEPAPAPAPALPAPEPPAPVETAAPAPVVPPPVPSRRSKRPGGVLRLHGGGEYGALPGPTGALGLAGGLLWPRLRIEVQAGFLAPRTAERAQASVRALLVAGGLQACGRLGRGAVEVPLCAGVEAGAMRGDAPGLPSSRRALAGWFAGVLGGGVAWHVNDRIGVWAALQLVLAPVRPRFELSNETATDVLFRPSPASGRLLLGIELRLSDPW